MRPIFWQRIAADRTRPMRIGCFFRQAPTGNLGASWRRHSIVYRCFSPTCFASLDPIGMGSADIRGSIDHLIEDLVRALVAEPEQGRIEIDILGASQVGMESRSEFEQGSHPAVDLDSAAVRLGDAGNPSRRIASPFIGSRRTGGGAFGIRRNRSAGSRSRPIPAGPSG